MSKTPMNAENWQKQNNHYLAAALHWLRLRLEKAAHRSEPSEPGMQNRAAEEAVARAAIMEPPPALLMLTRRVGLSLFEQDVLLLCAAVELDSHITDLCSRVQDDPKKTYPSFALAMVLFDDPSWDALSPERPLRYLRLIEINHRGTLSLTAAPLRADERIVNYIKGLNYLDDRLSTFLTPIEGTDMSLPPSQQDVADDVMHCVQTNSVPRHLTVIQLTGPDCGSKRLLSNRVAMSLGLNLYRLSVETLPQQASELETLARLWERETLLWPVALYLDARETENDMTADASTQKATPLHRFLARTGGLCFLDTRDVLPGLDETSLFNISGPTSAEQMGTWEDILGPAAGDSPKRLAGQFNLDVVSIRRIGRTVLADPHPDPRSLHDRLWRLCLSTTRPRLETLARRLDPKATWEDIVLPSGTADLLHQLADQVRHRIRVYETWGFNRKMSRGLGINALFSGESGTGKTMAAEVIANDLVLDLYRVDLSAVVSKYIGETEKNLRRLFDAAEDGGAILFFDEADALFGKRSEVKDSHDRYANIEINYLLQRMETYRGLAILATNLKSALDKAFVRRLRFMIDFPFPGIAERRAIWQRVFPAETPKAELDFDRLARLDLTGGTISNIAVNAAFLAANQPPYQVTLPLVLQATRTEFRKLEKPMNEAAFLVLETPGSEKIETRSANETAAISG